MTNRYYRNSGIKDGLYYGIPDFVYKDFSDIPGKEFIIQEGDRMDNIAEQIYGNASFWKAILIYNDIGYFFDPVPGTVIKLPFDIKRILSRL